MPNRPRLFAFSREIEIAAFDGWASVDERPVLEAMVDAFLQVARTRKLEPDQLRAVLDACEHPSANVRSLGLSRLAVLAHYFEAARDAFEALGHHGESRIRESVCQALPNAPSSTLHALLPHLLADPEVPICIAAAKLAAAQPSMEEPLERALAAATDPKSRAALQQVLAARRADER